MFEADLTVERSAFRLRARFPQGPAAQTRIARFEARVELGEVLFEAPSGISRARILDGEAHRGCLKQTLDLPHGREESCALAGAQGFQDPRSDVV